MFLNRLEFVKPAGKDQWRGKCPVHQGDNKATLSIKACSDGRILLHCHAHQCEPLEILKVCGLEMTDIMPERITHHASPQEKRKWRQAATMRDWEKARVKIQHEARVVWVAGKQIQDGKPLNDVDDARLDEALDRITHAGRAFSGHYPR
jgi:hypothetical protein